MVVNGLRVAISLINLEDGVWNSFQLAKDAKELK